ncbi:MAG: acyl-CoA thioesterase [Clostridia bacterium]|jgi:acyl-CoA hydrolase|nr:acyl-CoA thioesterase [Clostridia bacterium]MBQ2307650.1 acyl-CoA thioesterase [Clostridia bacterium]MBR0157836.1 acyl-CoA thioesterase [Clostridia bacterium]
MEYKRVADSYTEQIQILTQSNLNGYNRLFGGQLLAWIDIVAAATARRHSNRNVTTVCVSELVFKAPAYANDTILLCGHIVYAGRTSMDICVKTYVENLDGTRHEINTAYVTMVAIGEDERPVPVPGLILETAEEKREWDAAQARRDARKAR